MPSDPDRSASAPVPFNVDEIEDEAPEIVQQIYETLDPDDPLFANVDNVTYAPAPFDGLEQRLDENAGNGTALDVNVQDWRLLAPDDPKGELVQARIGASMARMIDHMISRTRSEVWASRSDMVREALFMYLRSVMDALQVDEPVLTTLLVEAEMGGRARFHAERRKRLGKTIDHVRAYLTELANLDDHEEAYRFLLDLAVRVRRIRVTSWRRHTLIALNSLPILRITAKMLEINGWDLPMEFLPAVGKSPT